VHFGLVLGRDFLSVLSGGITFSTSDTDPGVVLPTDYAFTLGDGGSHNFTDTGLGEATLITPGDQTLTVMDTADNTIAGSATITVNSGPGPAPHGQRSPPSPLQPSPLQGEMLTPSEPSANEVVALERWFVSFHDGDSAWLTMPRQRRQAPGETDWGLVHLFGGDEWLSA
jgi:hypothetical protein